jgi:hypothetical protein
MDIFEFNDSPEEPEEEETKKEEKPKSLISLDNLTEDYSDKLAANLVKSGVKLSEEDTSALRDFMKSARYGHQSSLAMKCQGNKCVFYKECPIVKLNLGLPLGENCPVEDALIEQWVDMYLENLGLNKEDIGNSIEIHMVYELAGLELIRRRAAKELSKDSLVQEKIVGYSPQGQPIYDDKPSQALLILERQSKIVNKLRDSLLATPKSAAQAGQISSDISTRTANILAKTKKLVQARKDGKSIEEAEIADADFEVIDLIDEKPIPTKEQEQDKGSGEQA